MRAIALALALLMSSAPKVEAARRWALEARLGGAWNLPMPLLIRQEGFEPLRLDARWRTRALEPPLYYVARVTAGEGSQAWALDLTHHKTYLRDPPPEVQRFAVSHGYNLLSVHRLAREGRWLGGAGAGLVLAHPESEVRGRTFDERGGLFNAGYFVTGPVASGLAGRRHDVGNNFYVTAELRITMSYARVPIAGGSARGPNLTVHSTVGLGWEADR